jgi:hypothetical protein
MAWRKATHLLLLHTLGLNAGAKIVEAGAKLRVGLFPLLTQACHLALVLLLELLSLCAGHIYGVGGEQRLSMDEVGWE